MFKNHTWKQVIDNHIIESNLIVTDNNINEEFVMVTVMLLDELYLGTTTHLDTFTRMVVVGKVPKDKLHEFEEGLRQVWERSFMGKKKNRDIIGSVNYFIIKDWFENEIPTDSWECDFRYFQPLDGHKDSIDLT